ncbi:MAG: hypothetical protein ABIJ34_02565 [archaeon]
MLYQDYSGKKYTFVEIVNLTDQKFHELGIKAARTENATVC